MNINTLIRDISVAIEHL